MKLLMLSVMLSAAALAQEPFQVKVSGHGQPMILIPGLSSAGETWDTTVAHYKDRFECHVLTVAGFAGVPRIPAPMLDKVRDGIAAYIRKNHLERPVIVGHSLGGFVAIDFAARYPELPGRIVIVDAYPFFAGIMFPDPTPPQVKVMVDGMRQYYSSQTQDDYIAAVKAGTNTRSMVTKDSDHEKIIAWGLATDRTAATDAMAELYGTDLRGELPNIKCPALVLGSWIGFKQYTDRDKTLANLRAQYAKLAGVEIQLNDTARHFIMWDDPDWMFGHVDRFVGVKPKSTK